MRNDELKQPSFIHHPAFIMLYQIWQRLSGGRTIVSPALHWKAAANCAMFESGPLTLKRLGGCGSVTTRRRGSSGRVLLAQTCAQPRKKLASVVERSIKSSRLP